MIKNVEHIVFPPHKIEKSLGHIIPYTGYRRDFSHRMHCIKFGYGQPFSNIFTIVVTKNIIKIAMNPW